MASIELRNVSLLLPIYNARGRALKTELLRRTVGGKLGKTGDKNVTIVHALQNISLNVGHGDRVGLIGSNGAGKTTLLRLMARIYPPTAGQAQIRGRVSALTDLFVGMDPEATGYENVVMRGLMLGLTRKQATALIPEIEEFTELGEYLELPIRTYSTGMVLRLAFAISTAVGPEILILDEMIGAGDAAFVEKAQARIQKLIKHASIMVLATHDDALVKKLCPTSVWLKGGRLMAAGETESVLNKYHSDAA